MSVSAAGSRCSVRMRSTTREQAGRASGSRLPPKTLRWSATPRMEWFERRSFAAAAMPTWDMFSKMAPSRRACVSASTPPRCGWLANLRIHRRTNPAISPRRPAHRTCARAATWHSAENQPFPPEQVYLAAGEFGSPACGSGSQQAEGLRVSRRRSKRRTLAPSTPPHRCSPR
jgi:hypothetical protein